MSASAGHVPDSQTFDLRPPSKSFRDRMRFGRVFGLFFIALAIAAPTYVLSIFLETRLQLDLDFTVAAFLVFGAPMATMGLLYRQAANQPQPTQMVIAGRILRFIVPGRPDRIVTFKGLAPYFRQVTLSVVDRGGSGGDAFSVGGSFQAELTPEAFEAVLDFARRGRLKETRFDYPARQRVQGGERKVKDVFLAPPSRRDIAGR